MIMTKEITLIKQAYSYILSSRENYLLFIESINKGSTNDPFWVNSWYETIKSVIEFYLNKNVETNIFERWYQNYNNKDDVYKLFVLNESHKYITNNLTLVSLGLTLEMLTKELYLFEKSPEEYLKKKNISKTSLFI